MKIVQPSVILLHATCYPSHIIEHAGRVCYQSSHRSKKCPECDGVRRVAFGPNTLQYCGLCGDYGTDPAVADDFVRMVLKRGHESVIEHVSAGVLIVTDRGVTHELVRHRLASFSQESTRFCDFTKEQFGGELSFIVPPFGGVKPLWEDDFEAWRSAMQTSEEVYQTLRSKGVLPELARSVLPNSLKSEIAMTCNAREWRHFLRLRMAKAAHPQMRQVAVMIREELTKWCPALFEDIEVK